jgi:quinol monooxygenase YgiN
MEQIARHGRMTAKEGKGDELAELMLAAAAGLEDDPGCDLYLINRQADDPDTIWITELWRSKAALDAAIEKIRGSDDVSKVMAIVADASPVELELLGGKGARKA